MNVLVGAGGELIFQDLPGGFLEALQLVAECPEIEEPEAETRLYPLPTEDEADAGTNDDWIAFVHPELAEKFRSDRQVVAIDLHTAETRHDNKQIVIPRNHFDAWVGALNQARIAIAAVHGFGEKEMATPHSELPPHLVAHAFRLHLYAGLQEILLEAG